MNKAPGPQQLARRSSYYQEPWAKVGKLWWQTQSFFSHPPSLQSAAHAYLQEQTEARKMNVIKDQEPLATAAARVAVPGSIQL